MRLSARWPQGGVGWAWWERQGDIVRLRVRWDQGAGLHGAQEPGLDASQTAVNESLDCALEARGGGGGRGGLSVAGAAPRARTLLGRGGAIGQTIGGRWGRAGSGLLAAATVQPIYKSGLATTAGEAVR